ncbi:beta-mannosidase, partial [Olea europaea subsp. europaea]
MLHNYAVKFFAPLLISPVMEDNTLKITLVNDLLTDVENAMLHVYVHVWNDTSPVKHLTKPYHV